MAESTESAESGQKQSQTKEEQGTLLEQMGGLSGLVSSTLPVLVLVPVNSQWGLTPALISALAVAVAILVWRLARKENLQPAISGFMAVALCAAIAWFMGMQRDISPMASGIRWWQASPSSFRSLFAGPWSA